MTRVGANSSAAVRQRWTVPFNFVAIPYHVLDLVGARRLDYQGLVILSHLYRRADGSTWQTRLTLAQLAEAIAWPKSIDWLSKRLRQLRASGLVMYDATPGCRDHVYVIQLPHQPSSEEDPRTNVHVRPSARRPALAGGAGDRAAERRRQSEQLTHRSPTRRPSRYVRGPSADDAISPALDALPWDDGFELVRALQKVREDPSLRPARPRAPIQEQHVRRGDEWLLRVLRETDLAALAAGPCAETLRRGSPTREPGE